MACLPEPRRKLDLGLDSERRIRPRLSPRLLMDDMAVPDVSMEYWSPRLQTELRPALSSAGSGEAAAAIGKRERPIGCNR